MRHERRVAQMNLSVTSDICVERTTCRICGSPALSPVIDLGRQYIASAFWTSNVPAELSKALPLEVVRCCAEGGCGLVQLRHSVAPRVLYHDYGYRSGTNEMMRRNLREIVAEIEQIVSLRAGDIVLDIGCNDGTLLESYASAGLDRVGIDPSSNVAASARAKGFHVEESFFSAEAFARARPDARARVVTSIAMFYDLENPITFAAEVNSVLADDGLWVIELSYMPTMLDRSSFDTICHEHLEYYALRQVEWILRQAGMKVQRVRLNDVNGGSFRLFIQKANSPAFSAADVADVDSIRQRERVLGLSGERPYAEFRRSVETTRRELSRLIGDLVADGKRIYAYGASTKGNTILQYCGLDRASIPKAADRNPEKWGKTTPGTNIVIVSEKEARAELPDYFFVLPWPFLPAFMEREHEFLARGGKFIVPLPQPRVIGATEPQRIASTTQPGG
jgi:NDP-4-keto-2,6-dideoxyhexose 3-C-methyltransferase